MGRDVDSLAGHELSLDLVVSFFQFDFLVLLGIVRGRRLPVVLGFFESGSDVLNFDGSWRNYFVRGLS